MKDLSGRLARWSLRLQSFDFQISHRKGADNVVADTLSRCVEELRLDADEALGFATTEFESAEYKEIRDEIRENQDRLPDATGVTPFFAVFGQHMYLHGSCYKLARKLQSMTDHEIATINSQDKRQIIRERISQHLHQAYERSSRQYNKRAREFHAQPGQEVYRRNFTLSDFNKSYNAKFARKFAKCRVVRPVGNNMFELEDLAGKPIGIYHAKDLRL
ncbi:hypothetical protein KR054_010175 [Drosophila jambulina]|nr:hypothetical protein KR054_010175 [Drosophila jambulina]